MDTLLQKHPLRYKVDQQIQEQTQMAEDSLKKRLRAFQLKLNRILHINLTPKEMERINKDLEVDQKQIQDYQDSMTKAIDAVQTAQLDRLHQLIRNESRQFANIHSLTYLISHKNILYAAQQVKDYTNELLVFLELKYRYRLTNGRLIQKKNSILPAK